MMLRVFAVAAAAAFLAGHAPAADPQLTGLVMPEVRVLAGVNVDQVRNSPFGQFVLAHMQANEASLRQFMEATGFDPRQNIAEVLIASTGQPGATRRPPGLVLVRGTFDVARIAAAAQAKGAAVETAEGVTILTGMHQGGTVAFLGRSVAVAGQADQVRAAVARRNAPVSLDPALAVRVNSLSTTQDAWMVSLVPPSALAGRLMDPAVQGAVRGEILESIRETTAGVKFGSNVDVTAEALTASDQDAASLAAVVKFLAGMAGANSQGTLGADLLRSLQVATDARTVRLSLSIPEARLENLIATPPPPRVARRRL